MIGLLFMAGIAVWLMVVIYLCRRIPRWLGLTRYAKVAGFVLFPILLFLPVADELIGLWQFSRLCEQESVIHLSDDWRKVERAKNVSSDRSERLRWYATRIHEREVKYQDADTKEIF
ncbi:hypothetical protein [Hydrogenophaga electricum]|uniref:hypothetical protein n=1 Tax=Hydrogenophaga electricum TaxID=1230953 RepID=UPI0024E0B73E|nr:hypothetical protein [Hydrogenophaga electricum]